MYSKVFEGKDIRISNKNYKLLLRRFDKPNFKLAGNPKFLENVRMENNTPCSLCISFYKGNSECADCPFAVFKSSGLLGCGYILRQLAPSKCMYTFKRYISYCLKDEATVVDELKAITGFLRSFKKESID